MAKRKTPYQRIVEFLADEYDSNEVLVALSEFYEHEADRLTQAADREYVRLGRPPEMQRPAELSAPVRRLVAMRQSVSVLHHVAAKLRKTAAEERKFREAIAKELAR